MVAMIPRKPLAPNNDHNPKSATSKKKHAAPKKRKLAHDQSSWTYTSPGRPSDGSVGGGYRVLRNGRP